MAAALPFLPYVAMAAQAVGAIQQGNAAKATSDYNAQVARNQAEQARQVSTAEQLAQQRQSRAQLGMTNAAIAQSGTGFGGTNKDILDQTQTLAELDVLNLAYSGKQRAQGFTMQSVLDEYQGKQAQKAGYMRAAGSILVGASNLYGGPKVRAPVESRSWK